MNKVSCNSAHVDPLVASRPEYKPFRNADFLMRWADDSAYWEQQPYGNRFYWGDGVQDYVPRDLLLAMLESFPELKQAAPEPVIPEPEACAPVVDGTDERFCQPGALQFGRGFHSAKLSEDALQFHPRKNELTGKRLKIAAVNIARNIFFDCSELLFEVYNPDGTFASHYYARALEALAA